LPKEPPDAWSCGLNPKVNQIIKDYLEGKIKFEEISQEAFKPKVITYDRSALAKENVDEIVAKTRHC